MTNHKITGNARERARAGMRHVQAGRYHGTMMTIDPTIGALATLTSAKKAVAHKIKQQEIPTV